MQADIIERSLQLDVRKICHPLKDLETTLFMRFLMMTVKLMILMIQTMTNLLLRAASYDSSSNPDGNDDDNTIDSNHP
jgi:hypothetical protein